MTTQQQCRILRTTLLLVYILYAGSALATGKLLVDFGGSEGENQYNPNDFPGWSTVQHSGHTNYTSVAPGGLTLVTGTEPYSNWQSLSGPAITLHPGDSIIATWHNATGATVSRWRPLISFTDSDSPSESNGEPQWYAMDKLGSSMNAERSVNFLHDGSDVQTVYTITSTQTAPGTAPASGGNHTLMNISNRNSDYKGLILDRIEIVRRAETSPLPPSSLTVKGNDSLPHSRIDLSWDPVAPAGGILIDHYRIYRDGVWIGQSKTESFIDSNLECNTNYSYTIEAVNILRSKSGLSQPVNHRTGPFMYGDNLISPEAIIYLGAFRFPSDTRNSGWSYRRGQLAYYPHGDPGNVDGDLSFPGSLYATGHTYDKMAAEISIPQPVISTDVEELPSAKTLQHFHEIEPDNLFDTNYVSIGLTYLRQNRRFYSTFYYWYNVSFNKMITHGSFKPDFSDISGGWWVGQSDEPRTPHYDTYAKFLAEIPVAWADANTPQQFLLSGGQRGGSSPDGPGLIAIKAWGNDRDDMPAPGGELAYTTLLEYGSDGVKTMNGWIGCDYFDGAAWAERGGKSAVVLAGQKSYGEYYYGFQDGTIYSEVVDNVPRSTGTDGKSKGGRGRSHRAMLIFYDPGELARVAKSQNGIYQPGDPLYLEPHEPQPYAAVDIDDFLLKPNPGDPSGTNRIESATYDAQRGYLYIVEEDVLPDSKDIIHVFQISDHTPDPSLLLMLPAVMSLHGQSKD